MQISDATKSKSNDIGISDINLSRSGIPADKSIPSGLNRSMGSTFGSTNFNQMSNQLLSTQAKKIVISKEDAEKAKQRRIDEQAAERAKKPQIYWDAKKELEMQRRQEQILKNKIERERLKDEEKQRKREQKLKDRRQKREKDVKYDPQGRLEVESSRSDEAYVEKVSHGI